MKLLKNNQNGFSHIEIIMAVIVGAVVVTVGFFVAHHPSKKTPSHVAITNTSTTSQKPKTSVSTPSSTNSTPAQSSNPSSAGTNTKTTTPTTKNTTPKSSSSSNSSSNSSSSSGTSGNTAPVTASVTISADGCYVTAISPMDANISISEYSSQDANGYTYPLTANQSSKISTGGNLGDNLDAIISDYSGNQLAEQKSVISSSSCPPAGQQ